MEKEITLGLRKLSCETRKRIAQRVGINPLTLRNYIFVEHKKPSVKTAYLLDKHSKGAFRKEALYPNEIWEYYED